jgi:hypothetical protein
MLRGFSFAHLSEIIWGHKMSERESVRAPRRCSKRRIAILYLGNGSEDQLNTKHNGKPILD